MVTETSVLLLTAPGPDFEGEQVISEWAGPVQANFEPAGFSFNEICRRVIGGHSDGGDSDEGLEDGGNEEAPDTLKEKIARGGIHSNKKKFTFADIDALLTKHPDHPDHYEVLGLAHLRRDASEDEIRAAHRSLSLQYHPDKVRGTILRKLAAENLGEDQLDVSVEAETKLVEGKFRRIQEALEVLTDSKKRQAFDSEEDLQDVKIPSEKRFETEDFFSLLRPIFTRFSYFSERKPVPQLGDDDTPIAQVERFYAFWYKFKSWRDFSHEDEFDLEEAEFREEKRWMERQNEKVRKKKKQAEREKIRNLVDLANQKDPRLNRMRESARLEREAAREAKEQAAREKREAEEKAAREEEERKLREAEEEHARLEEEKKQRDRERKDRQKQRSRFRKLCVTNDLDKDEGISVQAVLDRMEGDVEGLRHINKLLDGEDVAKGKSIVESHIAEFARKADAKVAATAPKQEPERVDKQEVVAKEAAKVADVAESWQEDELGRLTKAVLKFPVGTQERWEKISGYVETRSPQEVVQMVKKLKNKTGQAKGSQVLQGATTPTKAEVKQPAVAVAEKNGETATSKSKAPTGPPMEGWTKEQHAQMEIAMKKHNAQTPDRWDRIAECVDGKNKTEIMQHYKALVMYYKKVKAASAK